MTQEQIDKLKELKQLLDAGILTQEEMQAEKAKILGHGSVERQKEPEQEPTVSETVSHEVSEDISDDAIPLKTDEYGHVVFDHPTIEHKDSPSNNGRDTKPKNKTVFIVLGIVAVIVIIILLLNGCPSKPSTYDTPTNNTGAVYDEDSIVVKDDIEEEPSIEEATPTEKDDEFAFDPWSGSMQFDGDIYRLCSTRCILNFEKVSGGLFKGTINLILGDEDEENPVRFHNNHGWLKGNIRAKSYENTLTVVLDNYTMDSGEDYDHIPRGYFTKGEQIFRISYNNNKYDIKPLGKMEDLFDGGIYNFNK